jgi:hypothetical protein
LALVNSRINSVAAFSLVLIASDFGTNIKYLPQKISAIRTLLLEEEGKQVNLRLKTAKGIRMGNPSFRIRITSKSPKYRSCLRTKRALN